MKVFTTLFFAFALVFSSNAVAETNDAAPAAVSTLPATGIGYTSARLNGHVPSETVSWIEIRVAEGVASSPQEKRKGVYSEVIADLTCNTTYYYRAVAKTDRGNLYGENMHFTTAPCTAPVTPTPEPDYT